MSSGDAVQSESPSEQGPREALYCALHTEHAVKRLHQMVQTDLLWASNVKLTQTQPQGTILALPSLLVLFKNPYTVVGHLRLGCWAMQLLKLLTADKGL